jgi:hypothetical protein
MPNLRREVWCIARLYQHPTDCSKNQTRFENRSTKR